MPYPALDLIAISCWCTDPSGALISVNQSWRALSGATDEQTLGDAWVALLHPDAADAGAAAFRRGIAGGERFEVELRWRFDDDRTPWTRLVATPMPGDAGANAGYVCTLIDITARRAQRTQEVRTQRLLREVTANIPGVVYRFEQKADGEVSFPFLSDGVTQLYGVTPEVGQADSAVMYAPVLEEDLPGLMEIAERSRATLTRWDHEFRIRVDGVVRWIHGDAVPYRTADGTTIWNGLLTDVTERKRAEDALRRATAEAEAANAAKDLFLAQMSHELRTPMNGVLGMVDLLGRTELDQEQRAYAQTITDSARGLLHIIDEILDFSRISAGQIALEHQPFQLSRAVQSVIAMFQAEARDRGLALLSSVDPGLPGHLAGDARRLRQILVNLIGNAFKFTERGHVRVDVSGAARDGEVALVCAVQDTGIGIPADQVANVFEPFRQADHSIRRRFGGTGLGLAISQRLAAAMGGSIEVSSQEGAGSVFRVRLPLAIATADEIEALAAPAPPAPTRNDDPLTVLIADDNAINRAVLCGMLDKMGHRVEAVDNGRQAVDAARSCDFDLVLMDIQMPVLDGLSAMREIRAMGGSRRHLPIIAVTAEAAAERLASYLRDGMDAYLVKPIELDALVSLLANIRQDAKRHATN